VACLDAMRCPSGVRTSIFTSSVCLSASRIRYCDYLTHFYSEWFTRVNTRHGLANWEIG
jgi:hypothetical protein